MLIQIQKTVRILSLEQFPRTEEPYTVYGYLSSNKKHCLQIEVESENFSITRKKYVFSLCCC